MPTYDYRCASCGARQQHVHSMSSHTSTVACACGKSAEQTYNTMPEVLVKGNFRPYKLDETCMPVNWEKGNTDCAAQERRYGRLIEETRKAARANNKRAIKNGIQLRAKIPREIYRMRSNQFGKDYFDPSAQSGKDLDDKLRAEGLLLTN